MIPVAAPPSPDSFEDKEKWEKLGAPLSSLHFFKSLVEDGEQSELHPLPRGTQVVGIVPQSLTEPQIEKTSTKIVEWSDNWGTPEHGKIVWAEEEKDNFEIKEF